MHITSKRRINIFERLFLGDEQLNETVFFLQFRKPYQLDT